MRTTLKDIANYLNVSTTTVSRALNDKDDISYEMRQKVLEVARLLDYKPNSVAISLRKKTTSNLLGVIIPKVDHYFFSTILHGLTTTASSTEYLLMIGESDHSVDREKEIINQFQDHYTAGIIYIPSRHARSRENVQLLQNRGTPFILIDRTFEDYTGSFIQHDDFQGAFDAVEHLIGQGRKRIAMLRGDQDCSVSHARYQGYLSALEKNGLSFDQNLIISCIHATKIEGHNAAKYLFEDSDDPDGVFCITDQLAVGVLDYASNNGISVPQDLSIVGYSNSEVSQNVTPRLTTIAQNGYEMGRLAKEYLIEICLHRNVVHQKTFPSKLIIRGSS